MAEKKNKFRNTPIDETTLTDENQGPKFEINRQHDIEEDPFLPKKPVAKKNKVKKVIEEETEITEEEEAAPKLKAKKKEKIQKITLMDRVQKVVSVYQNERTQKIIGLSLILTGSYLCIAFISYFFTWKEDQGVAREGFSALWNDSKQASNLLGRARQEQ